MRTKTMRIADTIFLILIVVMTLVESFILHDYSAVVSNLLIILLFVRIIDFEKRIEDNEKKSNGR